MEETKLLSGYSVVPLFLAHKTPAHLRRINAYLCNGRTRPSLIYAKMRFSAGCSGRSYDPFCFTAFHRRQLSVQTPQALFPFIAFFDIDYIIAGFFLFVKRLFKKIFSNKDTIPVNNNYESIIFGAGAFFSYSFLRRFSRRSSPALYEKNCTAAMIHVSRKGSITGRIRCLYISATGMSA